MKQHKPTVIALAAVAAIVGTALYLRPPPHEPPVVLNAPPSMPSVMGAYSDAPQPSVAVAQAQQPQRPAPALRRQVAPGAADAEFRRLASPQATYAERRTAYAMALSCMRENGPHGVRLVGTVVDRQGRYVAGPCDLSQGTFLDAEVRRRLVTECAEKGDCWELMWNEGPFGYHPVFTAAEFAPLEKKALEAAVAKANPFALRYEASMLRDKGQQMKGDEARRTLTKALTYEIAAAENGAILDGMPFNPRTDPGLKRRLAHSAYDVLTQAEAQIAIAEARQLVATFKQSREQS